MATNARPVGAFTRKIAAEIRARRTRREMKQELVSDLAAIPVSTLSQIERGISAIDLEQLERLSSALGVSPDGLIASAIKNAEPKHDDSDLGPLVQGPGSVTARSTDEQHRRIEEWAERFEQQAPESSTRSHSESSSTEER